MPACLPKGAKARIPRNTSFWIDDLVGHYHPIWPAPHCRRSLLAQKPAWAKHRRCKGRGTFAIQLVTGNCACLYCERETRTNSGVSDTYILTLGVTVEQNAFSITRQISSPKRLYKSVPLNTKRTVIASSSISYKLGNNLGVMRKY